MQAEVRPLPPFEYVAPASLREALLLLREHKGKARLLSGGTDLIPKLKKRAELAEVVIDLNRIPELAGIDLENGCLKIGALTRQEEIRKSPLVKEKAPALVEALSIMASTPVRHRGTLAGNLCSASPAADTAPPLLVLDAAVKIQSATSERRVPLSEFFAGPGRTVLEREELLTAVLIPVQEGASAFLKLGRRKAFTLSIVSAAAFVRTRQGKIEEVRVALGAVGPTPIRGRSVEASLRGAAATMEKIAQAADAVKGDVKPISDVRASAEYRREMSCVLARRVLEKVVEGGENAHRV